jgi:DNA sulfur modification protein DndB
MMPQMYAALKMSMGTWTYFSVRMKMHEVATEIKFAGEVNDDKTLDEAIQRTVSEGRAGKQIVNYLVQNKERFFNSLVVAALDGNPKFFPVKISDEPQFAMAGTMFDDTFGVLTFDDSIKTYALDGQHRLFAIKNIIDGTATTQSPPPPGFRDETINVIFVVPSEDTARDDFLKSYRRLFSALNRHAKPTDENTNIIMDEDDRFAIVTRRLFSEFDFFKWDGHDEDPRIDTKKNGTSLSPGSTAWTTLVGLYRMNITLLWDLEILESHGMHKKNNMLMQDQPSDEAVDELYNYLDKIWDSILLNLPDLEGDPSKMRKSGSDGSGEYKDNLLFRSIGQTDILAPIARSLLNQCDVNKKSDAEEFKSALKPLSMINWNLQWCLWKDLLTVKDPDGKWKMRSEDRSKALDKALAVLQWLCGLIDLNEDQLEEMKNDWSFWLSGSDVDRQEREDETFQELSELRQKILNECS